MKRVPLSAATGALLVLLGGTVMLGWWLQLPLLVRGLPGYATMPFNAALSFVLAGGALLMPLSDAARRWRVATVVGGALAVIATLVLAEHLLQTDLRIDWAPLHAWLHDPNRTPGRMSAGTACGFLMSGAVLILATRVRRPRMGTAVRLLTLGVGAIGVLGLAGYLVSAPLLFPDYLFAGMAVHTAAGLLVLAVGLQSAWRRFEWARVPLFARDDDRITFVGATILVAIALAAGIASFAILQGRVQTLVGDNVYASLTRRVEMFRALIELREINARIAATRPAVIRNLRVIHAGHGGHLDLANVKAVVESFLKQGFSAIAYRDVNGKVIASGGAFVPDPLMSVTLATPDKPELLWDHGFLLRHRIPLRDSAGQVGTVLAEQPLPVLTRLAENVLGIGATGDMGLCVRREEQLQCFPQRLNPRMFFTPLVNVTGEILPATRALRGETGVIITRDYRAQNVVAAYGPVGDWGLGMVVKIDAAEIFQPIREQLQIVVGLLLFLVAVGTLLLRSQVRPLATKLVDAETQARSRTAELEAANKELEAFSYSVSHDLRAPLRHIDGFAEMMAEECDSVLNVDGRRYLGVISESVKHMGKLIDDLLAFSRMGRVEMRQTRVSMAALVKQVVQELAGDTNGRNIEWEIRPLPDVRGDLSMLKQVWANLISNSIKYTRPRDLAKIEIGCSKNNGELEFHLKDNGAGFDMKYAEKLFGVFQRLHRAEEFEGTGVGLASVSRIVARHGGRTWAQAKVDEGAIFYFTLPDPERNRP
ncbi:MAG TPA: ATP-binding protein [Burkholderiales bacterium]